MGKTKTCTLCKQIFSTPEGFEKHKRDFHQMSINMSVGSERIVAVRDVAGASFECPLWYVHQ
jgi:hypothetical protein